MHFLAKASKLQLVMASLGFGLLAVALVVGANLLQPAEESANIQRPEITAPQAYHAGGVFSSLGDEAMAEMVVAFAKKVGVVPSAHIVGEDVVDASSNEQPDITGKPEVLGKKISRVDQIKQMTVGQLVKKFKKDKNNYRGFEPAVFRLETELTVAELLERISVSDVSAAPVDANLIVTEDGVEKVISITPKKSFRPGQYTLSIDLSLDRYIEQDFTWGVLALNTNKSIYLPNDTGDISIAVLDDKGEMVCDAAVSLTVTDPRGRKTFLSTQNKKITVQDVCHSKELTVEPDYKAEYAFSDVGTYLMELVATTPNGTRTMVDFVEVRDYVAFDVSRVAATRIYPLNTYPVEITVTANQDFSGTIVETIPQRYVPGVGPDGTIAYDSTQSTLEGLELSWNVSLTKGETIVLGYSYDAPDISPQFHLTGPLRFVEGGADIFSEVRLWQIAVDAIAGIGIWRDSAGSQIPGTTWGAMNFATQQRNDGDYTFTGSNTLELDVTGRYLLIATVYYTDSSNGRVNYEGRFNYSGTGDFVSVWGSGYSRNSGNNDAWVRVIGLVDGNAVNDTVQLEMRRDSDAPTGGSVTDASHFQVIRLRNDTAYGMYTDTADTGAYGTTSWADVPYNNVVNESDTSIIQKQAGNTDIRLKKDATNFLVAYGMAFGTGGNRTQRVTKMVAGAADIENSFSYAYLRQTSDEYADPNGMFIYRNSGTSTDLSVQAQLGHADVAGSAVRRTSSSGMFVVELPSYAEVLISHDSTALQDVSGAGGDFNLVRDVTYNDSGSFTKVNNTTMNIEQDMDVLLMAQVYIDRPAGGTNSRVTTGAKFKINGTGQSLGYHGNYLRGDQSTKDTYNMAVYPAGVYAVSSGDDVQLEWFDMGDAGAVDTTVANAVGWSALNVTSLNPPMVSGTVYQGNESSAYNCSTDNLTIKVSLNGAAADTATCTAADGTFDVVMTTAPASGDIITTYIDSAETPQATNVHSSAGDRQTTGIDLFDDTVIVLHNDAGPVSNTDLNTGDNGDAGIRYAVSAGNLTVESGYELHVWTGDTFAPGGNVTTQGTNGHLHIDDNGVFTGATTQDHVISDDVLIDAGATLTAPSTEDDGTIKIGGSFTNNATGVFTSGSGRLIFTATSGTEIVDLQGDSLYDATLGETSGTATWNLSSALDVNGDLTIDYGTLDMNGSNNINLAGGLTINSNGIYTKGSGTFTFDGSGTSTWTNAATIDDLGTVVIDGTSKTVNLSSSVSATQVTVTDTLGLGSSGYELTLTGSGAGASRPFIVTGTLTEGTDSKVTYQGTGATEIESETYHDLEFSPGSGSPTYLVQPGTLDIDGDFTIGDGTNAVTVNLDDQEPATQIAGNLTVNNNATWTSTLAGTITFNGTTTPVTWIDNNATKQNMGLVYIDGPKEVDIASSVTVRKLDVTSGDTLDLQSSGYVLTVTDSGTGASRPLIVGGSLSEGTDSKVKFTGTGTTDIEAETYHDLEVDNLGDTFQIYGDTGVSGVLTVTNGTLDAQSYTTTLSGSGTPLVVDGFFTASTSTIKYTGTSATFIKSVTYYNLELSPSAAGSPTYTLPFDEFFMSADLTVGDGTNPVTVDWETNDPGVEVGGNVTLNNNTTWSKSSTATFTFNGTANPVTWTDNNATKQDVGLVTIDGPKVVDIGSSVTATKIDVTAGDTLDLQSAGYVLTITGSGTGASRPFVVGGTLTEGTDSKVKFTGTGTTDIEAETYHDLEIDNSGDMFQLYGATEAAGVLTVTNGTLDGQSYTLTLSGSGTPFVVSDTFDGDTSTVKYTSVSATNITNTAYNNLELSPSAAGSPTYTLLAGTLSPGGNLTIGDGTNSVTVDWTTNDPAINVGGNVTLNANSTWTKSDSATLTFNGTANPVTWTDNNATKQDIGLVSIDGPKVVDLGSSVTATKIDVTAGDTLDLQSAGYVLTITGSGTGASRPLIVSGALSEGTDSKIIFQGTSATEIESETYHDLEFSPASGSPTYTLGTAGAQTIKADGSVTIGDGTNAVTVTAETYDPTLDFNESLTIANAGIFQASSTGTFTIANDFTNNGTFTANSGTVKFDDAGQTSTLLYGAATTFYGLEVSTAGKTIEFDNADQTNIAASGSLTLQGTSCSSQDVYVNSDTGAAQFEINVDGTATVDIDFADTQYMNATGTAITADQSNDSSNNTSVTFANSCLPEQVVFTNASRTFTAGACNGAAGVFTMELQNNEGTARTPSGDTVIRVTSDSPEYTIYTDDVCSSPINPGDFTYTSSDTTKSVYIIDTRKSSPTWTITGTQQSGPETIAAGNQTYTINADSVVSLLITLPGETFTDGVGNSGTPDLNGLQDGNNAQAGLSFTPVSISAVDQYDNINEGYSGLKNFAWSSGVNYPGDAPDTSSPSYPGSATFTSGQVILPGAITLYDGTLDDGDTTVAIAVDDSDDGGDFSLDSTEFSVEAAVLQNYLVSATTPQTINVCFTGTNTISARDSYNNVRTTDASIVNMSDDGTSVTYYDAGDCLSSTTQYTMSSGTATMYVKTPTKQTFTITATKDGGIETGSSGLVEVYPGPANALLVRLPGQSFVDGTGITGSPSFTGLRSPDATAGLVYSVDIKAVDAFNNLVDSGPSVYTGDKTISFADSVAGDGPDTTQPDFPSSPVSFTNGEANGLSVTYYLASSGRTVEADDTGTPVSGTASSTFEVKAAAAENYNVVPDAYTQEAGVAFDVTVTARDDWENQLGALYTAPAGTYTWSTNANDAPDTTSPLLGTLVQGDFSSGVATKNVTLYKAESGVTFTATEPTPSTVTGTSTVLTAGPGEVSADSNDSQVTASSTGPIDAVIPITITLKDTWRNPVPDVPGADVVLSATASNLPTQPALATDANGQTTGYMRWYTTGVKTIEVTIQNTSLVQDDGVTPDADGKLDDTYDITINIETEVRIEGGAHLEGGTTITQ